MAVIHSQRHSYEGRSEDIYLWWWVVVVMVYRGRKVKSEKEICKRDRDANEINSPI